MATRKPKRLTVEEIHQTDDSGQEYAIVLSRPLTPLEVIGLSKALELVMNPVRIETKD